MPEDGTHWTRRDGTRMLIVDMDDAHLINTIFFIEKNRQKAVAGGFGNFYHTASEGQLKTLRAEAERRAELLAPVERPSQWDRLLE